MAARVSEDAWGRLDARAQRAELALGAWAGLRAVEAALGLPGFSEEQLGEVADERVRVDRIGGLVNELAAAEHVDREVPAAELAAVLDRVTARVAAAESLLAQVGAVFDAAGPAPTGDASGGAAGVGRRSPADEGKHRDRRVLARMATVEYDRVAAAAAGDGLSVGAWLGLLLEDQEAVRPVLGEAWGAVFWLRKALRRVATNLAQIEAVRASRGQGGDEQLARVSRQVDAAIRACLDVCGAIGAAAKASAAA
jgi:hypothetical protein